VPIDFFETEVRKLQDQFNEVFGDRVICDIRTRQVAIFSICNLGLLSRRITKSKDRKLIQKFMQRKTNLSNFFKTAIQQQTQHNERRAQWSNYSNTTEGKTDGFSGDSRSNNSRTDSQARATS